MDKKNLYISTIGCQMNVYDSEQIVKRLEPLGYLPVSSMEQADLILVNTCSIREKAEKKTFSLLGRLARLKKKNKDLIIGVGGCVAQQEGAKILDCVPHLDIVFGTHAISRLPEHIKKIELNRSRIVDVEMTHIMEEFKSIYEANIDGKVCTFVTIMQGCDNFCSYCVVPYVRGREKSRNPENIIEEIQRLVVSGIREVTLLGQNVNSYGKKEGLCSFAELLFKINQIEGLLRIRFTTSHPKDISEELICAFKELNKLCNTIHLPVQSGSNKILDQMNRKYTREMFLEKIERLRKVRPDIAFSSDIIVGFPGETDSDFEDTIDLIKKVEFDGLFAFKYSERPNTPASFFPDKVSDEKKNERLQILLNLQDQFILKKNQMIIDKVVPVLVEGFSKKNRMFASDEVCAKDKEIDAFQWTGRTGTNKIVHFLYEYDDTDSQKRLKGRIAHIKIEKAFSHSLWGKIVKIDC